MNQLKRVVVFCGSSTGNNMVYQNEAFKLGEFLAQRNMGIVYGGSKIGLMGALADGALQAGGDVTGVLPHFLDHREIAHPGITKMLRVDSMHQRKTTMHELSDGIIALPGGFGTLEELFEMVTWAQLGLHKKPIGILNVNHYYNHLQAFAENSINQGFVRQKNRKLLIFSQDIEKLLNEMENYQAPPSDLDLSLDRT